ncbi:hypothetical protein [Cellulosimicrobium arenosum]|uniref:Uncharacterized protein n=1 Tax=Cellulosimicrobium arenosum TaxID=2708133 RepID=A0A927G7J6_9MICO|nr:hypothetical protein [Cellulosimicrobium arenosum]MBD8078343.1 hypothetical protein [Cellulosimicrobium arenosum]
MIWIPASGGYTALGRHGSIQAWIQKSFIDRLVRRGADVRVERVAFGRRRTRDG